MNVDRMSVTGISQGYAQPSTRNDYSIQLKIYLNKSETVTPGQLEQQLPSDKTTTTIYVFGF